MTYKYELIYDTYDYANKEYIIKINLGDSKKFTENNRIKEILNEVEVKIDKEEWQSTANKYVSYDRNPVGEGYDMVYSLSFKNEYSRNYFIYLLDKYYLDLNYYENIYNTKALIKAGSEEDR